MKQTQRARFPERGALQNLKDLCGFGKENGRPSAGGVTGFGRKPPQKKLLGNRTVWKTLTPGQKKIRKVQADPGKRGGKTQGERPPPQNKANHNMVMFRSLGEGAPLKRTCCGERETKFYVSRPRKTGGKFLAGLRVKLDECSTSGNVQKRSLGGMKRPTECMAGGNQIAYSKADGYGTAWRGEGEKKRDSGHRLYEVRGCQANPQFSRYCRRRESQQAIITRATSPQRRAQYNLEPCRRKKARVADDHRHRPWGGDVRAGTTETKGETNENSRKRNMSHRWPKGKLQETSMPQPSWGYLNRNSGRQNHRPKTY